MKKIKIAFLSFLGLLVGCEKPATDVSAQAQMQSTTSIIQAEFEKSDQILTRYLDALDAAQTSRADKIQIICHDYPHEYKVGYMKSLLLLKPQAFTETELLKQLEQAMAFYKEKDHIQCTS